MKKFYYYLCIIGFIGCPLNIFGKEDSEFIDNSIVIDHIVNDDIEVFLPSFVFSFQEATIKLKFKNTKHTKLLLNNNKINCIINGENIELNFINGESTFKHKFDTKNSLSIYVEEFSYNQTIAVYPFWPSLLTLCVFIILIIRKVKKKKNH